MDEFTIIDIPQRTQAWKDFRKGKIGSSDAASIMGLNPFESKLACWERMVYEKEREDNENMKRGRDQEPLALDWFNKQWGGNNPPFKPVVLQSKKHPQIIASLDGWDGLYPLEIKCPKKPSMKLADQYNAQIQHQLYVTGSQYCWYMEYLEGEGVFSKVFRDDGFIRKMVVLELEFLASIADYRPPEPTDSDWTEETNPELIMKSFRYKELSHLRDKTEMEMAEIRGHLIMETKHPRVKVGDLKMQKITRKGTLNYEQILKDYEITNAETYRKEPQVSWRILTS